MSLRIDPEKPLNFAVSFESPQVAAYRFWYKLPAEPAFTIFATGTDDASSNPSSHQHTVRALPAGSEFAYVIFFTGNPQTTYRVVIEISQGGRVLEGGTFTLTGTTKSDGFAQENDTIQLAA